MRTSNFSMVWWPAFAGFQDLHPEYELSDFRDGKRYLDSAYLGDGLTAGMSFAYVYPDASAIFWRAPGAY